MTQGAAAEREQVVGVVGGTGAQGRGLALRLAMGGVPVIVGSREADRAVAVAEQLGHGVVGMANAECAARADVVIAAVPWEGHAALLASLEPQLAGKVLVDCANPLGFDADGAYALTVPDGSAAQQAAALLPRTVVVGAFHHISAKLLLDQTRERIEMDVLVLGDDRAATDLVEGLVNRIAGMRGVYGGRLRNCGPVEALTANLIAVNRRYRAHSGLRVTDL